MTRKEQEELRAEKRRLKAEKKAQQSPYIMEYAKQNNISLSCATFRWRVLNSNSPRNKRVQELVAQGMGFSSARRQEAMEYKGTWVDKKWKIDEGYKQEDFLDFTIKYNPNAIGLWEVTYKNKPINCVIMRNRLFVDYYIGKRVLKNTGNISMACARVSLSVLVWLKNKGDIPAGYVVDHIDNNSLNNNLDNLQLLTRGQNIKKNTRWSKEEVAKTFNPEFKEYCDNILKGE